MEWLEPWSSVVGMDDKYRETFTRQLASEVCRGHPLYKVPVDLIGRGNGDDCLFAMRDGTGRVAVVHLVWQGPQKPPWPATSVYNNFESWAMECMLADHRDWQDE